MPESRYASLLRKLKFEPWIPPDPDYFPTDFKPDPPTFINGFVGDTFVIDETGQHWKHVGNIDMTSHGFADLIELVKIEQGKVLTN